MPALKTEHERQPDAVPCDRASRLVMAAVGPLFARGGWWHKEQGRLSGADLGPDSDIMAAVSSLMSLRIRKVVLEIKGTAGTVG